MVFWFMHFALRFLRPPLVRTLAFFLIGSLLNLSLETASSFGKQPSSFYLAPRHDPLLFDKNAPLRQQELEAYTLSSDPDDQHLSKLILSRQKVFSGIVLSFCAAFVGSLPIIGQEMILHHEKQIDYLLVQPLLMAIVFLISLKAKAKEKFFIHLFSFFPTLWKTSTGKLYAFSIFSHQVLRNILFFYILPVIGSTVINMIGASIILFTPLIEWIYFKKNHIQISHWISFLLIVIGVVGCKFTELQSGFWLFFVLALVNFFLAALESVQHKKIIQKVGDFGSSDLFTLTRLSWMYLLSFSFWGIGWLALNTTSLLTFPLLQGATASTLIGFLTGPWMGVAILTVLALGAYRFLEQKTKTITHFPVSFLEAILQTKIVFTAMAVTAFVSLSNLFSISLPMKIHIPTWSQVRFMPIILAGVLWLSLLRRKEEKALRTHHRNNHLVLGPQGKILTHQDWITMRAMMNHNGTSQTLTERAKQVWEDYFFSVNDRGIRISMVRQERVLLPDSLLLEQSL